eukprot:3489211-Prymnesium_polylepis.1
MTRGPRLDAPPGRIARHTRRRAKRLHEVVLVAKACLDSTFLGRRPFHSPGSYDERVHEAAGAETRRVPMYKLAGLSGGAGRACF